MDSREPAASSDVRRTFEVGPCLGAGGFGEVYHAVMDRQGGLRTEVALKVLHQGLSPQSQAVERLRDEGRVLGLLRHPAIVRVLDLVVLDGRVTLVSEYIEGVDLHEVRGEIPLRAAVEVIGTVADALAVAWRQLGLDGRPLGLVHRDIKPANIRLGRHGEVKLLDFGIAKAQLEERDANTSTGLILGSMPYLSPERLAGKPVGPPADVYALGSTLWETLAGRRLMAGLDVPDQVRMALDDEEYDEFIEDKLDDVDAPKPVKALLRSMLDRRPDERPTAHAVANLCDALVANLEGRTLRTWARTWTWPDPAARTGPLSGRTLTDGFSGETRWVAIPSAEPPVTTPADTMDVQEAELTPPPARRSTVLYAIGGLAVALVAGLMCFGVVGAVAVQNAPTDWGATATTAPDDDGMAVVDGTAEPGDEGAGPGDEGAEPDDEPAGVAEPAAAPPPSASARPRPADDRPTARPRADPTPKPATEPTAQKAAPAEPTAAPAGTPEPTAIDTPAKGRIEVAGRLVPEIRAGKRRVSAGEVTAGTYTLWYDFGEGLKQAGTIEVGAGQTVTVQCNPLRYDCSSR